MTEVGSSPIETATTEAINFEVKIQLADPPPDVRPGFSCSADIITDTREKALAAPLQALVVRERPASEEEPRLGRAEEEDGVYVYDPDSDRVTFAAVETGITGETEIEILSGLEPGQEVVTGPFRVLRELEDGDDVRRAAEGQEEKE